jgi:hypothetical protein
VAPSSGSRTGTILWDAYSFPSHLVVSFGHSGPVAGSEPPAFPVALRRGRCRAISAVAGADGVYRLPTPRTSSRPLPAPRSVGLPAASRLAALPVPPSASLPLSRVTVPCDTEERRATGSGTKRDKAQARGPAGGAQGGKRGKGKEGRQQPESAGDGEGRKAGDCGGRGFERRHSP